MKLTIRRNQADIKGFFGNHKGVIFKLYGKCEVTSDELSLIERYKAQEHILVSGKFNNATVGNDQPFNITVNSLLWGTTFETGNLQALLKLEEDLKESCRSLKTLLEVMSSFGGEEVLEIV